MYNNHARYSGYKQTLCGPTIKLLAKEKGETKWYEMDFCPVCRAVLESKSIPSHLAVELVVVEEFVTKPEAPKANTLSILFNYLGIILGPFKKAAA